MILKKKKDKIPERTITRLPIYYNFLLEIQKNDIRMISSQEMARKVGIKASQFRKDLSYFGEFGTQGLGYSVEHLIEKIGGILHLNYRHNAVIVGVGNLGTALMNYPHFGEWGFHIVRAYDLDTSKVGRKIGYTTVKDIRELPRDIMIPLGIIAVPPSSAQEVANLLVASGVRGILNFTGSRIEVPNGVVVRSVDLTYELAVLNYYLSHFVPSGDSKKR
ncbi:MAG: redox-sensing transcriptional repressor Rex [Chloroflexi bacterium]|nr:redox-sensing transcriptional repressor Rex [Chloroflexota bacterium]